MRNSRDIRFVLLVLVTWGCVLAKPMEGVGEDGVVNMEVGQDTPTEADSQWSYNDNVDSSATNQESDNPVYDSAPQVQDNPGEAVVNEQPVNEGQPEPAHIPREEEERRLHEEEIDWGHGGGEQGWGGDDIQQQEQDQQQQQQQQQQEQDQQQHQQEEVQVQTTDQQEHMQGGGQHGDIGVINPEEIMHDDDGHAHDKRPPEVDPNSEEALAEARRQAELRRETEEEELRLTNPNIIANVHDGRARTAAEFMKDRQFGPNDVEEIIHGGHHVHGAEQDGGRGPVQAGDVERLARGEAGTDEDQGKGEQKVHLTVDPEHLMHAGQGGDHDHNPHLEKEKQIAPGADDMINRNPEGFGVHPAAKVKTVIVDKDSIGPTFEKTVHEGQDHVHEPLAAGYKAKNRVRYQDIIDLGLSQEALKGIDLSKVLEQEQREFDDWQKEAKDLAGDDDDQGDDNTEKNSLYWQKQVTDLRRTYLAKLYAKVRDISQPDLETAEWEKDEDEVRGHDGESQVEHEMEMWASTLSKKGRKPYKMMQWTGENKAGEGLEGEGQEEELMMEENDL